MAIMGLKLTQTNFSAAIAAAVRKYRKIPISSLKELVENNDFILSCDLFDKEGIIQLVELKNDLADLNINSLFYKDSEPLTDEYVANTLESYEIIRAQTEYIMNLEVLAEEEDG